MSKKRKGRRAKGGGRVTPRGTRPSGYRPMHVDDGVATTPPMEDHPLSNVIEALGEDHPIDLLTIGSSMAWVAEPQQVAPGGHDEPEVGFEELLETLLAVDDPATTGLLGAFALFAHDEVTRRRCSRGLAGRRWAVPDWFPVLGDATVERVMEMSDILGDSDNVSLQLAWPTGHRMVMSVFLDHNVGGSVRDAFALPVSIDEMFERAELDDADDFTFTDLDPAAARARIEDAVRMANMTWPPFESDTWPESQPMLHWALSLLPDGADPPEPVEWDQADVDTIAAEFLGSDLAEDIDEDDEALVDHILWYGTDYGNQDPYRWGPSRIEIFLADWVPRKIVAAYEDLEPMPEVLRAFVRWAHRRAGIPDRRTGESLEAIDTWTDDYLAAIADEDRVQGAEALLDAFGVLAAADDVWDDDVWDGEDVDDDD